MSKKPSKKVSAEKKISKKVSAEKKISKKVSAEKKISKKVSAEKKVSKKDPSKKKYSKKQGSLKKKKGSEKHGSGKKKAKRSRLIKASEVDPEQGMTGEESQHNIGDEESELETQKREMTLGEEQDIIQPVGYLQELSEAAGNQMKKFIKSSMKEGKERATPYSHSGDLADPWKKKRRKESEGYKLMKELLGLATSGDRKERWPSKQGTLTLDMADFMSEIPNYLKGLGILKLFQRIIMNLYMMNPRPKNPCLEIFHLLDKWFGASDKSKVVETLEKEFDMKLLKELRMIQEIGKLKTLCHFLLPEEYGPEGEYLDRVRKQPSDDDVLIEYAEDVLSQVSKSMTSQSTKKRSKKKKDKDKDKGKAKKATSKSSVVDTSKNSIKKKKKTK